MQYVRGTMVNLHAASGLKKKDLQVLPTPKDLKSDTRVAQTVSKGNLAAEEISVTHRCVTVLVSTVYELYIPAFISHCYCYKVVHGASCYL